MHSAILALLPKEQMVVVEPDKAQPKLESTISTYQLPPLPHEGKEQRSYSDYKSSATAADDSSTGPTSRRIELLIVDDSRRNRRLLIKTLVIAGFTCEEADDGQNAVNMVCQHTLLIFFSTSSLSQ